MAVQLPDSDSDRQTCDYCGAHVTANFRRTYGTEDRRAKRNFLFDEKFVSLRRTGEGTWEFELVDAETLPGGSVAAD